jgi:hypothetical protein
VFVAAVVLDGIVFVIGMVWAWKLRAKLIASRANVSVSGDK